MINFKDYLKEDTDALSNVDEAISVATRLKRKQNIRKYKARLKLGRLRASKRVASRAVLKKRAQRQARTLMFKRLIKGKSKSDLAYSARQSAEKMINRRKAAVQKIAQRLIPKVKRAEMQRKLGKSNRQQQQ